MTNNIQTETGAYVILDSDGYVIAKADVIVGDHPATDAADPSRTFDVDENTDISQHLADSPANSASTLPEPPHDNAREALSSVTVDERYHDGP